MSVRREGDPFAFSGDVATATQLFLKGKAVFLITELGPDSATCESSAAVPHPEGKPWTLRVAREDYERNLYRHKYTPLLYIAPLHVRIAYLYGCLNRELRKARDCAYVVWWRRIGTAEWRRWFTLFPYCDATYDPAADPVYL